MTPRAYHVKNDFGLEVLVEKANATQSEYVIGPSCFSLSLL